MSDFRLSDEEKAVLLRLARETINSKLSGDKPAVPDATESLNQHCGAFVTLHISGNLRGCIGHITSDRPLLDLIPEMALASAFDDPRFPPLEDDELPRVELEISVLSPLQEAAGWQEFEAGTHGVLLSRGHHQAVFLPQVAPEQGWDAETTLTHLAMKAGLAPDDWRKDDCRFQLFTAVVFAEEEYNHEGREGHEE